MKNKPKFIYLQTGLEDNAEICEDFNELSGISWCADKIYSDDLEFISVSYLLAAIHKMYMEETPTKENALVVGTKLILLEEIKNLINKAWSNDTKI